MEYSLLSTTDLKVSRICLGTMGYGHQISEGDAHAQLDAALAAGINFIDTAEMYPIPPVAPTFGLTETFIGNWLEKTGRRKEIVLATKISGPMKYGHIRGGKNRLDRENIELAVEESLKRLKTDYIDLYQLHWPDRNLNTFGERGYAHQVDEQVTPIEETLMALADVIKSGKVRFVGLSNESPWGTMEFLRIAREKNLPRMITIQNVYNLLNRHYEIGMAEVSMRENIGLLAYSPLGYGVLGGRYFDGNKPSGGRFMLHTEFAMRYRSPRAERVTKLYADIARKHGLSLPLMSLAFVNRQPFVTSTIIGASAMWQLDEDIKSLDTVLSDQVIADIEEVQERYPNIVA